MKIYVSGPITGIENKNRGAFAAASSRLTALGYDNLNPHDLADIEDLGDDWTINLRRDLKYLMDCDAVLLLPGWEESKGARLEVLTALELDMKLIRFDANQNLIEECVASDIELTPLIPSYLW